MALLASLLPSLKMEAASVGRSPSGQGKQGEGGRPAPPLRTYRGRWGILDWSRGAYRGIAAPRGGSRAEGVMEKSSGTLQEEQLQASGETDLRNGESWSSRWVAGWPLKRTLLPPRFVPVSLADRQDWKTQSSLEGIQATMTC